MTLLLIYLLGAIIISFLCSVLEAILMSTPISFITMKEEEGDARAIKFKKFKTDIERPLTAILIVNTIANTLGAAGVGAQATEVFGSAYFGIVSAIMTVLILVFSEIIPKTIGTHYWKKLYGFAANALTVYVFLMYPFVKVIEWITQFFPEDEEATVSREEISAMANVGEDEEVLEESENKIIQNLMKLDSVKASDVMTPQVVAAIASENMTLKDFYKKNSQYLHYSRIPVYNESPDFITGYILRSDALELLAEDKFDMRLRDIRRNIAFFNEDISIADIWDGLLKDKEQIALIIDEYGSFRGILTLEDIIETLLGLEIIDEKDEIIDLRQYAQERWQKRQKRFMKVNLPDEEDN